MENTDKAEKAYRWVLPMMVVTLVLAIMSCIVAVGTAAVLVQEHERDGEQVTCSEPFDGSPEAVQKRYEQAYENTLSTIKKQEEDERTQLSGCKTVSSREGADVYQFGLDGACTPDSLFLNGTYYAEDQMFVTWCSTSLIRHYLSYSWTETEDGLYVDSEGYLAVGASFGNFGDIIEGTPLGDAKVYDQCPPHTVKDDNGEDKPIAEVFYFVSWK